MKNIFIKSMNVWSHYVEAIKGKQKQQVKLQIKI
ncbi:hypothetical protein ABIC37_005141 [Priestia megaterium]